MGYGSWRIGTRCVDHGARLSALTDYMFLFEDFLERGNNSQNKAELQRQAEAEVVGAVAGREPAANSDAAAPGNAPPAAATIDAVRARSRTLRIRLRIRRVRAIPILTPFPNVATHVVKAKFVSLLRPDNVSLIATITIIPSYVPDVVRTAVLITTALIAASRSIFPLSLSRQTETLAGHLIESRNEALAVVPRNLFHGIAAVALVRTRIFAHYMLPQGLRHFKAPNVVVAKRHAVRGTFVAVGILLLTRGTHRERATINWLEHKVGNTCYTTEVQCGVLTLQFIHLNC